MREVSKSAKSPTDFLVIVALADDPVRSEMGCPHGYDHPRR